MFATIRSTEGAVSTALHSTLHRLENPGASVRMVFVDYSSDFDTRTAKSCDVCRLVRIDPFHAYPSNYPPSTQAELAPTFKVFVLQIILLVSFYQSIIVTVLVHTTPMWYAGCKAADKKRIQNSREGDRLSTPVPGHQCQL